MSVIVLFLIMTRENETSERASEKEREKRREKKESKRERQINRGEEGEKRRPACHYVTR